MNAQLTSNEINEKRQLLGDYAPAKHALDILEKYNGNYDASFNELWVEKNDVQIMPEGKSLWQTTLKVLRQELCGDDGFRGQLKEYTKNPGNAPLLTIFCDYTEPPAGNSETLPPAS